MGMGLNFEQYRYKIRTPQDLFPWQPVGHMLRGLMGIARRSDEATSLQRKQYSASPDPYKGSVRNNHLLSHVTLSSPDRYSVGMVGSHMNPQGTQFARMYIRICHTLLQFTWDSTIPILKSREWLQCAMCNWDLKLWTFLLQAAVLTYHG